MTFMVEVEDSDSRFHDQSCINVTKLPSASANNHTLLNLFLIEFHFQEECKMKIRIKKIPKVQLTKYPC